MAFTKGLKGSKGISQVEKVSNAPHAMSKGRISPTRERYQTPPIR